MKVTQNGRKSIVGTAVALLALSWPAAAQERHIVRINLSRALELAKNNSPALQAARHRIAEAEGDLIGASMLLVYNPKLAAMAGPRIGSTAGGGTSLDLEIGIQQRFEIGGQRGHRVERASAQKRASEAAAEVALRVLNLAVALTFYDAVAAADRVQIRVEGQRLAERLFEVATRRLERGAGTRLELNTARIRRAEAQRNLVAARAASRSTGLRMKQLLALPSDRSFTIQGTLASAQLNQHEDALVARALERRPDLRATAQQIEAAQATVGLSAAEAWPDISFGISYGMEEGDNILLGGIRVPIPIFNRNQGQRHRARATVGRLRAEQDGRRLAIEAQVRRAYTDYSQARDALSLYGAEVLQAQDESLALLQRAFEAGEVGYANVIVVQREVLEGREGLVDVRLALSRAHAALLASVNLPYTHDPQGDPP